MTSNLKQVTDQLARVFEALDVGAPTNWDTSWQLDCQLQDQALNNAVDISTVDIYSGHPQSAVLEDSGGGLVDVEVRGAARNEAASIRRIKSLMERVISARVKRADVTLPPSFLPLYEAEFETEPFAGGHFWSVHRGVMAESGESVVVEFFSVDDLAMDERAQVQVERELGRLFQLNHSNVMKVACEHAAVRCL
ncbi:hypothetical protein PHYSODRAFT_294343 [Phytophthora sojae]|uniref:Protein kinase domain-containing protein n=1 Tax=Phytophthora sojae (strain P6497) TaxID=1094619 RepID=G4YDY3_PHYSP|nr:hypothetical protein PHYSODRAFT_294343 [Phytophthora sojae]EGZ29001.1 hypothetical protein PHYSODRAFT_294343 [Phytophthora sojae]|eukprot:XP_009516276.1 hypothetical protein PHYSODRAFT_294343 [Phytophthora sojae]